MDPDACFESLLDHLEGNHDALEALDDLVTWLERGGFPPNWTKWLPEIRKELR